MIGYFSTYSLGNIYAAQLFEYAAAEIGDLEQRIARGDSSELFHWLRQNVHSKGQCYNSNQLVEMVTGCPPSSQPLLKYLRKKVAPLYGI